MSPQKVPRAPPGQFAPLVRSHGSGFCASESVLLAVGPRRAESSCVRFSRRSFLYCRPIGHGAAAPACPPVLPVAGARVGTVLEPTAIMSLSPFLGARLGTRASISPGETPEGGRVIGYLKTLEAPPPTQSQVAATHSALTPWCPDDLNVLPDASKSLSPAKEFYDLRLHAVLRI